MISITSKSPYAVLALAELARNPGTEPVPIGELARRREVPVQFLEQLFAVLRRSGIVSSQRGVKGGYRFAREPSTITVLEVVELLDGPLRPRRRGGVRRCGAGRAHGARADDDRRRARARDARRRREHVPHLTKRPLRLAGQPAKIWLDY